MALDSIDQAILRELRADARMSHAEIGTRVRLSRNAVRQRIARLERDGFIGGYTIVERRAGADAQATLLISRVDRLRGGEVLAALQQISEVVRCDIVSGDLDLVVQVEAETSQRIREIWESLAQLDGVRDITTALSLRTPIDRVHA